MHSTSTWPSHSERGSGLPCMRWPLQRLRRLRVVLVPVLLPAAEQRRRPEQCRRVRQQRKAELVASRFVRGVHACRGSGTYAGPPQRRETERPCLTFGTSF